MAASGKLDSSNYKVNVILGDGTSAAIRSVRPEDTHALMELFLGLADKTVYAQYFAKAKGASDESSGVSHLSTPKSTAEVGIVATFLDQGQEKIYGLGRFVIDAGNPSQASIAIAVGDAYRLRGIATLLLEHMIKLGRACGVEEFKAKLLGPNNRLFELLRASGLALKQALEAGEVIVSLNSRVTAAFESGSYQRGVDASAKSLEPILKPKSIAVVGASRKQQTIGWGLLSNLLQYGFTGDIYPINPQVEELHGIKTYPSVTAIGKPVDLAIIAVPAVHVPQTVEDCIAAKVRSLVIISSGVAEVNAEKRAEEKKLVQRIREAGMRVVGPNCMGVLNTDPAINMNGTFAPLYPPAGNIAMLSQSGALGIAILDYALQQKIGISSFVSVGNKADVSGNDLISFWSEDDNTKVIALYLESFGNPSRFAHIAPVIARKKPIVAVKSGRSGAGSRAASSHSASLASLDVAVDSLFEQAGVIRTDTLEELFDVTKVLVSQPLPEGPRVAVLTNAGGPAILLADALETRGLNLPELSAQTISELKSFLPAQAGFCNPIDMIAAAGAPEFERAIKLIGNDPRVDALIVIYVTPLVTTPEAIAPAIARGAGEMPPDKPVLSVFMGTNGIPESLHQGPRGRIPVFSFPENAARALAATYRYNQWRKKPEGKITVIDHFPRSTIRAVIERSLASHEGRHWMDPKDVTILLRAAGIETVASATVQADRVLESAKATGYPLVLKIVSADVVHKSDVGGVKLGIKSDSELLQAVEEMTAAMQRIDAKVEGFLLQRQIMGGIEGFVGVTSDLTFGPIVVCGMGGIHVELLKDVSFCLSPVTDVSADEMIGKLKSSKLLEGFRGAPAGDRHAFASVLTHISALVEIAPEISELDLNPVKIMPPGQGAIVVDARVRLGRLS